MPLREEGIEVCRMILYERPIGSAAELKPQAELLYEWNQKICPFKDKIDTQPSNPELIGRGRYRFSMIYSFDTVKSGDIETEPWKRRFELGETRAVYSNEIVLN